MMNRKDNEDLKITPNMFLLDISRMKKTEGRD
jgi:hypothetical protein